MPAMVPATLTAPGVPGGDAPKGWKRARLTTTRLADLARDRVAGAGGDAGAITNAPPRSTPCHSGDSEQLERRADRADEAIGDDVAGAATPSRSSRDSQRRLARATERAKLAIVSSKRDPRTAMPAR